jgi:aryl-alcohol dehydrogenase-like predicted oxidoreductase
MQHKQLGNTGLIVSQLCLGTMTFSNGTGVYQHIGNVDQAGADALVKASVDAGINFFGTADIYSHGHSEEALGRSFRNLGLDRRDVVLATKGSMRMGPGRNAIGASRGHFIDAHDASLKRLGTDYIDLYQIHQSDALTRSRRRCARSTISYARARYATSAARIGPRGRSRPRSECPSGTDLPGSRRCRLITRSPAVT